LLASDGRGLRQSDRRGHQAGQQPFHHHAYLYLLVANLGTSIDLHRVSLAPTVAVEIFR